MEVLAKGKRSSPASRRLAPPEDRRKARRKLFDRLANWAVAAGGFTIIASILAILIFIAIQIAPLFRPAKVTEISSISIEQLFDRPAEDVTAVAALSLDENQEIGGLISSAGVVRFFTTTGSRPQPARKFDLPEFDHQRVTSRWQATRGGRFVFGTDAGAAVQVSLRYNSKFLDGSRSYQPAVDSGPVWLLDPMHEALKQVAFAGDAEGSMIIAGITAGGRVLLLQQTTEESLFGDAETDSSRYQLEHLWSGTPTAITVDAGMSNLYLGCDDGKLYHWGLSADGAPQFITSTLAAKRAGAGITALRFLLGERTLVVGDSDGNTSSWFLVRDKTAQRGWRLTRIRDLAKHANPVVGIASSPRGKGFISTDAGGRLFLQHSTSGRFLADFGRAAASRVNAIAYAPKANGALSLDEDGVLTHWRIDNPHPEASLQAFFGKVWYEGYPKPEYVWQSTGGTDEFEPKLSLVPLIFGSLKGTLYALLIAVPLAICGALFTSQFMHQWLRNKIKPTVETMAALPSVVLGFLGGLWLAPRVENIVPGLLLMTIILPTSIVLFGMAWKTIPRRIRNRFKPGIEALILMPVILLGIVFSLKLNALVEMLLFAGDFKAWLYQQAGWSFDQRNALVVGMAMGFAVIPIIYTIAEDAFSNVPGNLISGSLALGATRWQTALRVVVPTAAAGIFSAVMIGFGRAVGETMIVLMATGNTPIMDWNIFNGFRTLSANIAVEIPEAPVAGTLYRVLFLAAMLLFFMTFVVNTVAELVRQRLRRKFQ